jgi:hypothetical protein
VHFIRMNMHMLLHLLPFDGQATDKLSPIQAYAV